MAQSGAAEGATQRGGLCGGAVRAMAAPFLSGGFRVSLSRLFLSGVLVVGFAYVALCAGLYLLQRRFIFPAGGGRPDPLAYGVPEVRVLTVRTADGLDLNAWYLPPARPDGAVALFLHGNGGTIGGRAARVPQFAAAGWGVLLLDYRGYGGNPGSPSEEGLALDARAAYDALLGLGIAPGCIVVWGESLGTAPAVRLAREAKVAAVVLEAPFTSMTEMARRTYPFVPVAALLKDRFDTLGRIGGLGVPLFIEHGERDGLVPVAMGERLFRAAGTPARAIRRIAGAGHDDLFEFGAVAAGVAFVAGHVPGIGAGR
jgi:fermentation-respiration switch protein FrsA (DUF1100 family)